jgi:hypothetical protein
MIYSAYLPKVVVFSVVSNHMFCFIYINVSLNKKGERREKEIQDIKVWGKFKFL